MINPAGLLDLADWRRRIFDIYREVRLADEAKGAWDHWREARAHLFRNHPQSPVPEAERASYKGPYYFDYDPEALCLATVEIREPETSSIEASEGVMELIRFATARFELYGEPQTLDLFWFNTYGGGVFLSFRDGTSGKLTYGGCRYLLDTVKGADLGMEGGRLVLDFNFAYQPSCSYDPRWVCPLAPVNNRLSREVRAGERLE